MMSLTQKHTLCQVALATSQAQTCQRVCFSQPKTQSNFFSPLFGVLIFFATDKPRQASILTVQVINKTAGQLDKDDRTPAANSVLPQLAVMCKIKAECYHQTFVPVDSEVLQNRQLRQHAKPLCARH